MKELYTQKWEIGNFRIRIPVEEKDVKDFWYICIGREPIFWFWQIADKDYWRWKENTYKVTQFKTLCLEMGNSDEIIQEYVL